MNRVQITAKLYECRDTAKQFAKLNNSNYKEMLVPYTNIIKEVMKANKLEEIPALLKISQTNMYQDSGIVQLMFMAATVELIEPTE